MIETITFRWPPGLHWRMHETLSQSEWLYRPHRHVGFGDISLVCEGKVTNIVNGNATELPTGSLAWTRERDLHEIHGSEFRFLNFNMPDEQLALLAMALGREKEFRTLEEQDTTPFVVLGKRLKRVEAEWIRLLTMRRGPAADLLANELALGAVVALLTPMFADNDHRQDLPLWLRQGISHIDNSIEDGVTVADLAEVCGRSAEHVSRSFRKHLGMSPSAYINQQRVARAALLLSSTNREILDICYTVGFQSASYFYRLFRKEYGLTPRQYRRKYHPMFG